jgi:Cof subfamily protein (haloacid dehalogenase superfamily)
VIRYFETRSSRLRRLPQLRCVACDLDGTVLRGDGTVGEETRRAARQLMDAGVHIVLASGRTDGFTREFARELGTPAPVISLNGALVIDGDGVPMHEDVLPAKLGKEILDLQQRGLDAYISVFTASGIYVDTAAPLIPRYLRSHPEDIHHLDSISAMYDQAVMLVVAGAYSMLQQYSLTMSKRFGRKVQRTLYQSGGGGDRFYLELRNARASKASGLEVVLRALGVPRHASASIGDYTNDIEMCKFTGVSAAMCNGTAELQSLADIVTTRTNDEDGVAEFFDMILSQRAG